MKVFKWVEKNVKKRYNSNFHTDKLDDATRAHFLVLCKFLEEYMEQRPGKETSE